MSDERPPITMLANASSQLEKLAAALVAAQAEMPPAPKDAMNPHFRSRYADLEMVWTTIVPILNRHGLCVIQRPGGNGTAVTLSTVLLHTSGQWIESIAAVLPAKADPQGYGSALTYLRRYAVLSMAGGVTGEDDDAEAASGRGQAPAAGAEVAPAEARPPRPPDEPVRRAPRPATQAHTDTMSQTLGKPVPPPAEPSERPTTTATEPQVKAIRAIAGQLGLRDDALVKGEVARIVGHPVEHLAWLTKAEASTVITTLQQTLDTERTA